MSVATKQTVVRRGHRAELEFGSGRGAPRFRGQCECGWRSEWYQRSGMVASLIGEHQASGD